MSKTRKTVNVSTLLDMVNDMIATSTCSADGRAGMAAVLNRVLHETGNYRGFRYLSIQEVPCNNAPGIVYGEHGEMLPFEERFKHTDRTRVKYY